MYSILEIKGKIEELSKLIDAPADVMPTYGDSKHDGTPDIKAKVIRCWILDLPS